MTCDGMAALHVEYERVARAGIKRFTLVTAEPIARSDPWDESLAPLILAGLASRDGSSLVLHHPRDARVELDQQTFADFELLYDYWRRSDEESSADETLYGEIGYWRHWWNMLQACEHPPLRMDIVLDDSFSERAWLQELDHEILTHVVTNRLVRGRILVPSSARGSQAEGIVAVALDMGFAVKEWSSAWSYVMYDDRAAVLSDPGLSGTVQGHRLSRRAAVVQPLRALFELRWASALPWDSDEEGVTAVLRLLADGWGDDQIARALGISRRTVTRRITEAMQLLGARSRFELGMKYGQAQLGPR